MNIAVTSTMLLRHSPHFGGKYQWVHVFHREIIELSFPPTHQTITKVRLIRITVSCNQLAITIPALHSCIPRYPAHQLLLPRILPGHTYGMENPSLLLCGLSLPFLGYVVAWPITFPPVPC